MLTPGHRMMERAGALYFYNGRRLVTVTAPDPMLDLFGAVSDLPVRADDADTASRVLGLEPEVAAQVMSLLRSLQLIEDDPAAKPRPGDARSRTARYCSSLRGGWPTAAAVARHFESRRVLVLGAHSEDVHSAVTAAGLPASVVTRQVLDADSDLTDAVLVVTAGADGSAGELPAINELALRRNLTWLPIGAFDGAVIRVGPLMIPGATACFRCTVTRLAANVEFPAEFVELAVRMPAADAPPAVDQWAIGFATLLLLRWLGAADAGAAGVLHTLVPAELTTRAARVYPVPRCCACHAADWLPAAAPWEVGDDGR